MLTTGIHTENPSLFDSDIIVWTILWCNKKEGRMKGPEP